MITYGFIQAVEQGEVIVAVENDVIKVPVNSEDGEFVTQMLVDGLHIVAVDVKAKKLIFDPFDHRNEEVMPELEEADVF